LSNFERHYQLKKADLTRKGKLLTFCVIGHFLFLPSCRKEENRNRVINDNDAPYYDGIPTVLVQNYVNRLFIDLIGREPLDTEMDSEVERLKRDRYDFNTRDSITTMLQEDLAFREGDSSYKAAYYQRLYELFKARMLEGASDADINFERGLLYFALQTDSVEENWYNYQLHKNMIAKLDAVLEINEDFMYDSIDVAEAFARLLDNAVYDRINMNSFNFINACFNDLFGRFPSQMEFDNSYEIIEYNNPSVIFGKAASDKAEFIEILVTSREFYEGLIRWAYTGLLARDPLPSELETAMMTFANDHNFPALQRVILRTDEYANFEK
jgi:hypothetical protein